MVGLFRKTASEPELGDRIAGLTRRRGAQPAVVDDAVAGESAPADLAPARPALAEPPTTTSLAPHPPAAAPASDDAERPFATLTARPMLAPAEPPAETRPETPKLDARPEPESLNGAAADRGERPRSALLGRAEAR